MSSYLRPAATMLLLLTFITGAAYPALVTLIAQTLFAEQSNGSVIKTANGDAVGSKLIGKASANRNTFGAGRRPPRLILTMPPPPVAQTWGRPIRRWPTPSPPASRP